MLLVSFFALQQDVLIMGNTTKKLTDTDNVLTFQTEKTHVIISVSSDQAVAPQNSPESVSSRSLQFFTIQPLSVFGKG